MLRSGILAIAIVILGFYAIDLCRDVRSIREILAKWHDQWLKERGR
jgi:hypothetical protein